MILATQHPSISNNYNRKYKFYKKNKLVQHQQLYQIVEILIAYLFDKFIWSGHQFAIDLKIVLFM